MNRWNDWLNPIELGRKLAETLEHDDWTDVEPHALALWNQTQGSLPWEGVRDFAREAWEQRRQALAKAGGVNAMKWASGE